MYGTHAVVGPQPVAGKPDATQAAAVVGTITRKITVAEPKSPAPKAARSISMKLAPMKVAVAPTAVATEFMVAT